MCMLMMGTIILPAMGKGLELVTVDQNRIDFSSTRTSSVPHKGSTDNSPPSTPVITGPTKGKYNTCCYFNFTSTDPDGDNVYYWIQWDEGCPCIMWLGPYPSGQTITVKHTFFRGMFDISCQAKDMYNATSDWGHLKVTMPSSVNLPSNWLLERLIAQFLNAFQFLQYLLRY